jgi:SAM-dependent methyltransferase
MPNVYIANDKILCPICGADNGNCIIKWERTLAQKIFRIAHCNKCHFGFNYPMPSLRDTKNFYDEHDHYIRPEYNNPILDQRVFGWTHRVTERILGKKGDLLDIGCGRGDFLTFMKAQGWQVTGLEVSPQLVEITRKRGIACNLGNVTELTFPPKSFDVITFRDVLEHIPTPPQEILKICNIWLKDGGIIYIKVPNLDWIDGTLGKVFKRGFDPAVHLHHFSQRALSLCLAKSGMQPVKWCLEPPSAGNLTMDFGYLVLKSMEFLTWGLWPQVYFSLSVFARKVEDVGVS